MPSLRRMWFLYPGAMYGVPTDAALRPDGMYGIPTDVAFASDGMDAVPTCSLE